MGSVDDYDIEDVTTPIHRSEQWQNLSPEDRRRMAVSFYYAILGLCQKKSIQRCAPSDAKFIAKVLYDFVKQFRSYFIDILLIILWYFVDISLIFYRSFIDILLINVSQLSETNIKLENLNQR